MTAPASGSPGPITDELLPLSGGTALKVRQWTGAEPLRTGAWVLHLHGGAFVGGSLDHGAAVAGLLARSAALVVSLDYPLAPAHPFPQAAEAAHAALRALDRKRQRRAPHAPLYVAGEEAGGNLAAAAALMARDRAGPALAGQILLSPMLDACIGTASQRDARDGPLGGRCADGWRAYLKCSMDASHPYATPADSLRLGGLPPTLLVTAQDDPQRDETLAYHRRLQAIGVDARALVFPGGTGWPRSFAEPEPGPWGRALAESLRLFITTPARAAGIDARPAADHHDTDTISGAQP